MVFHMLVNVNRLSHESLVFILKQKAISDDKLPRPVSKAPAQHHKPSTITGTQVKDSSKWLMKCTDSKQGSFQLNVPYKIMLYQALIHAKFTQHRAQILSERGGKLTYSEQQILVNIHGDADAKKIVHELNHLDQLSRSKLSITQNKNKPRLSNAHIANITIKNDEHQSQMIIQQGKDKTISKKGSCRTNKKGWSRSVLLYFSN